MSAIGGVFSRTGRPYDPAILENLGSELQVAGPDGQLVLQTRQAGMVSCPFHGARESIENGQPIGTREGLLLSWTGRLDNRDEIRAALGAATEASEARLFLTAYRTWGIGAFQRLIGDFAVAVWDPEQRRLVLATDALGIRQLYYHVNDDFAFWATRARPLLAAAQLAAEPDPEYVLGFLVRHRTFDRSPFRRLARLEASHVLIVGPETVRTERYWAPDSGREIRYRTDEEYEEHFRQVFRQAVSCRLRAEGPVFCELSGGLDSSSMVCVGDEILAAGGGQASGLRTVSYVYDRNALSDEREFIGFVEEKRGQRGLHINEDDFPVLRRPAAEEFRPDQPNGQLAYLARHGELAARMRAVGARVLLRGFGGDEAMWNSIGPGPGPLALADLLSQGRLSSLLLACQQWARRTRTPFWRNCWWGGLWPLLPSALRHRRGPYRSEDFFQKTAELIGPALRESADLDTRILGSGFDGGLRLPSQRYQCSILFEMAHFVVPELIIEEGCVELRYPYYDRRLIELMLAIPIDQKIRPGETRSLMRRSLRGTLPEPIRRRRSKGGPEEAFFRAVVREWDWISQLSRDSLAVEHGFIDREALARTLWQARHGVAAGPLLRVFCLEFWLGTLAREEHRRLELYQRPLVSGPIIGGSKDEEVRDPRSVRAR